MSALWYFAANFLESDIHYIAACEQSIFSKKISIILSSRSPPSPVPTSWPWPAGSPPTSAPPYSSPAFGRRASTWGTLSDPPHPDSWWRHGDSGRCIFQHERTSKQEQTLFKDLRNRQMKWKIQILQKTVLGQRIPHPKKILELNRTLSQLPLTLAT